MPSRLAISYTAGSLFPVPEYIRLAGERRRVIEFRVKDVGRIERAIGALAGTPMDLLGPSADALNAARESGDKAAIVAAAGAIMRLSGQWPPRLGSPTFGALLATGEGKFHYLWTALYRTDGTLTPERCIELAESMGSDDWAQLERVLWGRYPWEVDRPAPDDGRPRHGVDWGSQIRYVVTHCGMGMKEIGNLFVSQFFFLTGNADPEKKPEKSVYFPTRKESRDSEVAHAVPV